MVRSRRPSSPTWRAFLENHVNDLVSVDFFVVPTVTFKVLFVFVVLAHARRRIMHVDMLAMDCPEPRSVQGPEDGEVVEVEEAGGLYRHYERRAA